MYTHIYVKYSNKKKDHFLIWRELHLTTINVDKILTLFQFLGYPEFPSESLNCAR